MAKLNPLSTGISSGEYYHVAGMGYVTIIEGPLGDIPAFPIKGVKTYTIKARSHCPLTLLHHVDAGTCRLWHAFCARRASGIRRVSMNVVSCRSWMEAESCVACLLSSASVRERLAISTAAMTGCRPTRHPAALLAASVHS